MDGVFLFYVIHAQQLQLFGLVLIYEKEVVFVPKVDRQLLKLTDRPHRTKQIDLRQNLIYHRKKNHNWRKVLTELITFYILDRIKIRLMERCQYRVDV